MPLLMLLHERRTTDSQELLFKQFKRLTGVSSQVYCDREKFITSAVEAMQPGSGVIYCWNHILLDVRVIAACLIHTSNSNYF